MDNRPSWDEYFIKMAHLVSERSTCRRRKVGAVLVRDKRILATGYNGASTGQPHCLEIGCLREELNIPSGQRHELCRALHAEQNAILQCVIYGVSAVNSILYVTTSPCSLCAKQIVTVGVQEVIIDAKVALYPDEAALEYLKLGDVKVRFIE